MLSCLSFESTTDVLVAQWSQMPLVFCELSDLVGITIGLGVGLL